MNIGESPPALAPRMGYLNEGRRPAPYLTGYTVRMSAY